MNCSNNSFYFLFQRNIKKRAKLVRLGLFLELDLSAVPAFLYTRFNMNHRG